MFTIEQLATALECPHNRAAIWHPYLVDAMRTYSITVPANIADFFAQIGHESEGLEYIREIWGPTPVQRGYEGRADLGNTQPGDGRRYLGRGPLQITGRANYRNATARIRLVVPDAPNFEAEPEYLEEPRWGALTAAEFWARNGCNELADSGEFDRLTRRINGGMNGIDDRRRRRILARLALGLDGPAQPKTMRRGHSGPNVQRLQARLNGLGYQVVADGKFGAETEVAVRTYQSANRLAVDGVAGAKTLAALGL